MIPRRIDNGRVVKVPDYYKQMKKKIKLYLNNSYGFYLNKIYNLFFWYTYEAVINGWVIKSHNIKFYLEMEEVYNYPPWEEGTWFKSGRCPELMFRIVFEHSTKDVRYTFHPPDYVKKKLDDILNSDLVFTLIKPYEESISKTSNI